MTNEDDPTPTEELITGQQFRIDHDETIMIVGYLNGFPAHFLAKTVDQAFQDLATKRVTFVPLYLLTAFRRELVRRAIEKAMGEQSRRWQTDVF